MIVAAQQKEDFRKKLTAGGVLAHSVVLPLIKETFQTKNQ